MIVKKCKYNFKGGCYAKGIPHNNPCAYCVGKVVKQLKQLGL